MNVWHPLQGVEEELRESELENVYAPLAVAGGCFYCGRDFELYPVVQWAGYQRYQFSLSIFLHPHCAQSLSVHLARDVRASDA